MANRTCSVEGCAGAAYCRSWCRVHYQRYQRHGDPEGTSLYTFDDHFFDVINTEAKAYWLGFITADGCVRTDHHNHQLKVKLKVSDAPHLEKLKAALAANHPIKSGERRGVAGAWAALAVSSPRMVDSLAILGVTPRKSLTAQPWNGPADLMRHYWRGLFDGDGCITKRADRNKWALSICGSEACVLAFADWARGICGATSQSFLTGNVWHWKVAGFSAPQTLARELYRDATAYLDRKHELALDLLARVPLRDPSGRTEYCTEEGCGEKTDSLNRCTYHYRKHWLATGPECKDGGCDKKRFARGYCHTHYMHIRKAEKAAE